MRTRDERLNNWIEEFSCTYCDYLDELGKDKPVDEKFISTMKEAAHRLAIFLENAETEFKMLNMSRRDYEEMQEAYRDEII